MPYNETKKVNLMEKEKPIILNTEDYLEPECPLTQKPEDALHPKTRIPQKRIIEKMDELMAYNDYNGAERLLNFWLSEAKAGFDTAGEFFLYNEQMGFYRQRNRKQEAYQAIEDAFSLLEPLGYTEGISGATAYVNAATVYCAFNEADKAIPLYRKAETIYLNQLEYEDERLGGLYNNMAEACLLSGQYDDAESCFHKAIDIMMKLTEGELEAALSWLNLVDLYVLKYGRENLLTIEKSDEYLETARALLDADTLERNHHYAYVAQKCVGIYEEFGYFGYAKELRERIRAIHEGN